MGRLFLEILDPGTGDSLYGCKCCKTHLAKRGDLISKSFHSRNGRAYLFNATVNVIEGPCEDRRMTTGLHTVCDLLCTRCMEVVGWRYHRAFEESQKYKEGKFILERSKITDTAGCPAPSMHLSSDGDADAPPWDHESSDSEGACP